MLHSLMATLMVRMQEIRENEEGQGLVEYALILALVSVLLVVALTDLKDGIAGVFGDVIDAF